MKDYYSIPENVLNTFANKIYDQADGSRYIKVNTEIEQDDMLYIFSFEGVAYYSREAQSGEFYLPLHSQVLNEVVPIWLELHAFDEHGDEVNTLFTSIDFTNKHLKNIN